MAQFVTHIQTSLIESSHHHVPGQHHNHPPHKDHHKDHKDKDRDHHGKDGKDRDHHGKDKDRDHHGKDRDHHGTGKDKHSDGHDGKDSGQMHYIDESRSYHHLQQRGSVGGGHYVDSHGFSHQFQLQFTDAQGIKRDCHGHGIEKHQDDGGGGHGGKESRKTSGEDKKPTPPKYIDVQPVYPPETKPHSDGNTSFLRAARAGNLDKVLEHLKSNIDINTSNANGLNALHLSSKDGHITVVEELLQRGALVDSATKKGNTALHIASLAGQEEVVKLLVLHGATVNVQSQNGFTPLYMAAQENHDNVVRYLLTNGANQTLATEDGFTPLAVAMQQGHDKVVTVLLESDTRGKVRLPALHIAAKKDDCKAAKLLLENEHNPDVTSKSGFTPLHIASHYGNDAIGHLLIQKGADANYAAKHSITPLHVAAKWGKTNMVALLLEKGATIEAKTRDGLTPLHCAARSGHEQVVDMLVERGAPISCKTKNGLAPLHMAAQGDHVDAARILLYHRAPVDEVTVDYLTALHVAAHCGHVRVAKLLLDRQADANARALNGFTPLHIACKKNRIKVVELLLKHGASIGATTESGLTPLHVASFMGCMNIVIYLLQHDANPDVPTVRGETPLHLAARANQTDIIRILLRNGAQVDARAREQQTPLHIASRLGNVDIVMLLLQHGAKVDTATKDMYTALHIAAKEGQDEVAAVLIDNGASLNATTKKGFTPLHLAAKYGQIKVAKLLLQKEASVDTQGKNGVTPLHVAAHYDHQNVALLLLDKGASPHASAKNGHTPLHIAAKKNQMDIANTLLEYGARPSAESKAGFTPLHLSAGEGHADMSALLVEHQADVNQPSKNGLTPLHLCAQEDRVPVAEMLVKNGANIESATKGGFTPLHVAAHYGQANMVRFLLGQGADVQATTSIGYTPLHQAAQQGHTNIVNQLLERGAEPNSTTNTGQTPLGIAQKLGYINVIETLKIITTTTTTTTTTEEKYKVIAPEAMQETFMSDSEEEGGEDTMLGDNAYRYLTADEMKSLGDDSLPIDVTRDERVDSNRMALSSDLNSMPPQAFEDSISPQHYQPNYTSAEYNNTKKYTADNVDIARHPINIGKLHWKNFLVSFLVDARGGAMRGCRHSGVRVIVPPRSASSPTRITCRYVRPQRTPHPPPLMEGEALASRVLELGPVGSTFLGPVIIEVPHFAALRGKEREIVVLRSDNGETWREHNIDQAEEILNDVLHDSFDADDLSQMEDPASGRITRILTHDFPQYFAVVSRIRQEVHAIGPEGGMVSSTVVPQVQAVFPPGALTKKIKVGLQAQPIDPELTAKLLGHGVAVSPVVTVEPRRRKFHKAITLSMPAPRAHSQGMINQYSGSAPTLRLLCSITGGTTRAQWEDVTGSTPLTFVNECVSFTTTVSARFWLMDCRNIQDASKMATELYREAIHVPFMAKFVVFAKRIDPLEARLRVFCMTDDKEDKTLEHQEHFTEVAKSRDVEVLEGKPQFVEFAGNLVPITKSGEQLQFAFRAFRENRLPFSVRVKDQHAEAIGRSMFMKEPKVAKGEPPQQPICILNIVLPEDIVADTVSLTDMDSARRHEFLKDGYESYRPDPRISDMSNLLGEDWVALANQLGLTSSEINVIKSEYPDSVAKQAQSMLRMWIAQSGNRAQSNILEVALRRIGREEIIPQCLTIDPATIERVSRPIERLQETPKFRVKKDTSQEEKDIMKESESVESLIREDKSKKRESFDKYSAEEKVVEEPSEEEEEDFNVTVTERRVQIEKKLSQERQIPASSQRVEIVQEITSIKRQSLVEDKIMQVEKTITDDVKPPMPTSDSSQSIKTTMTTVTVTTVAPPEPRKESDIEDVEDIFEDATTKEESFVEVHTHKPDYESPYDNDRTQTHLLEAVTHELEVSADKHTKKDESLQRLSRTPPPSPADFLLREQATALEDRQDTAPSIVEQAPQKIAQADDNEESCYKRLTLASEPPSLTPTPKPRSAKPSETVIDSTIVQLVDTDETDVQPDTAPSLVSASSVESDSENYYDRKKFWEGKEQQEQIMGIKKRFSLREEPTADIVKIMDKRKSIHEVSLDAPTPKPRSSASIDRGKSDLLEEDVYTPPVTEYQASFKEHAVTTTTVQEPTTPNILEKENSTDSDIECSGQFNVSSGYDNTGYISDSGDVEHYISDSEIEDRVPQIRERQMSVFQPNVSARKNICHRSASLPTEDMYEVSDDSIKLRKQYYEEQIKKEMVEDQMMTEIEEEDVSQHEHKTLEVKRELYEPSGVKSVPEPTHEDEYDMLSKSKAEIENKLEQMKKLEIKDEAIFLESDRVETGSDIAGDTELSYQEANIAEGLNLRDELSKELTSDNIFHIKSDISKPSDSLEVHVDKSELEDSEKMIELDQDATDIDTKSLDSTELSPKTLFNSDIALPISNIETKILSPIRQPVENIQTTVWEAPIHIQGTFDEKAIDILVEKAPGHERDDELSVGTREESDLGSEIHQDHSDSYSSDRIKSESHDIEKLILESLHHQKISPEEAQVIANELIADIELEIQRRNSTPTEIVEPPAPEYAKNQISEYLQHLAEAKGLDSREIELVQSVLARKHRELAKLSRDDTQASSMEITDEELRYSGADFSPCGSRVNILEEQIDQLKAERVSDIDLKSFELKTEKPASAIEKTKATIMEEDESLVDISSEDKTKTDSMPLTAKISETVAIPADDVPPLKIEIKRGVEFSLGGEKIVLDRQESEESKPAPREITTTGGSDSSPIVSPVKSITDRSEPTLRKKISDVDTSSSSSKKSHRKSGLEVESYSSSGESHYHSFEVDSGKSRPCSSDVEVLVAAGSSEYESALASQETSSKSHVTSAEYVTAVSSFSSKESMKSLDSESSGNLASVEVSEASETLVPSEFEFNGEQKETVPKADAAIRRQTTDDSELDLDLRDSPDASEEDLLDEKNVQELSSKMKRSHEMNFPTEIKSPQMEQVGIDDKLGTSLDEGSVLSVSLSSTSSLAQTRTVIENIHSNQHSFGSLASLEDVTGRSEGMENQQSPALSAINLSVSTRTLDDDTVYDSVTLLTSSVEHEGIQSVSTQVTSASDSKPEDQKKLESKQSEVMSETKKKCHRRNESTSNFTPERIIFPIDILDAQETSTISKQKTEESDIAIELKKKFTPDIIDKHRLDKRDSHTKSSTTSSERSSFEEAEAEAAFNMVAHISPVHKIKQICPIIEDETAEINELEAREQAEREIERNRALNKESAAFIPDIKVTQHMAPMDRDGFSYPDLEIEEKEDDSQNTTPQTPASISSKSSDSTDQGREYILEDSGMSIIEESEGSQSVDDKMIESRSEAATVIEKTICETDKETESPGSDSFELIEKPDIIDDFVVIEEVAKEAHETDAEGKSLKISKQKYVKKHDTEVEQYLVKSAPEPSNKLTGIQYFPQAPPKVEELGFEFEESPPQAGAKEQQANYVQEFDKELEENKKWIEQQFLGDQASMIAAGYGYEMDFERAPLEDIKEEDATDFDSSRIGSLSSHKESGGSLGSVKDSYSSTPEYDVLAGRKYFTKSGENDDISMSSLQEFENLERAMSLENRKFHQGSNSSSNGSFKNRYSGRSAAGDDVSVSSLKEFEGLEKACIAAHTIEQKVQEEEAMLSQIEECQESIISETESCETFSGTDKKLIPDSDEEDYEKRMFEIDEIIRQAQTNVEHFVDFKEGERTESIGRGDSVEEVSKVPDLDLDLPIKRIPVKTPAPPESDDLMITSTDSLDVKVEKQIRYDSSDSLDAEQKTPADLMTDSTDSIEFHARKSAHGALSTDSIEAKIIESDSLDLAAAVAQTTQLSDSIDEDGSRIGCYDHSTASTGKDYSLSGKEDVKGTSEFMLESCDSIASTSTATYAHQYEGESIYSGSCTSGDSNTMVSSTDTIDPIMSVSAEVADASVGTRKIWFDDDTAGAGRMYTTEYYEEGARPRITETIEREPEGSTIKRVVEMPPEVLKMTFSGSDAQSQLEKYMESLATPAESVEEFEEVDADGNVHTKRIVKKTTILTQTKEFPEGQGVISRTVTDEHGSKTIFTQAFDLGSLDQTETQKSTTGMSSQGESSQAVRSEEELQKDDKSKSQTQARQVKDQQELSQEMRDILKALEEDSYK